MTSVELRPARPIAEVPVRARSDRMAFDELYQGHYRPMVRLAHTLVDTQQQAEEIAQDAFAAVFQRFDEIDHPVAYLRATVLNGCRRALRRRIARRHQPIPPTVDGELGYNHVIDAIRRLPNKQRSMVVLRYDLQLTDSEIAETLDVPLGTVKSTIHRALATLRAEIPHD